MVLEGIGSEKWVDTIDVHKEKLPNLLQTINQDIYIGLSFQLSTQINVHSPTSSTNIPDSCKNTILYWKTDYQAQNNGRKNRKTRSNHLLVENGNQLYTWV